MLQKIRKKYNDVTVQCLEFHEIVTKRNRKKYNDVAVQYVVKYEIRIFFNI